MKKIIYIVIIVLIIIISIILFNIKNTNSNNLSFINEEVLDNLDINTYDVKAKSYFINNNEINTLPLSYDISSIDVIYNIYYLRDDTNIYVQKINNNVIEYEKINKNVFEEILLEEDVITYFWIYDDKTCKNIIVSYE